MGASLLFCLADLRGLYLKHLTREGAYHVILSNPRNLLHWVWILRYSSIFFNSWLVDMGGFENLSNLGLSGTTVVWYLFSFNSGERLFLLVPAIGALPSIEKYFRNGRWLERETGEMHGIFFNGKRDRRSFLLLPWLYKGVLLKSFPTSGFFELRLDGFTSQLRFFHLTWED